MYVLSKRKHLRKAVQHYHESLCIPFSLLTLINLRDKLALPDSRVFLRTIQLIFSKLNFQNYYYKPRSSIGSVEDLRKGR